MEKPHVYRVYVSFVEGIHVSVRKKAIWEEGKENEFREGEEFIA